MEMKQAVAAMTMWKNYFKQVLEFINKQQH